MGENHDVAVNDLLVRYEQENASLESRIRELEAENARLRKERDEYARAMSSYARIADERPSYDN